MHLITGLFFIENVQKGKLTMCRCALFHILGGRKLMVRGERGLASSVWKILEK